MNNLPEPGRTYDLLMLQSADPLASGPRTAAALYDGSASAVTGALKLVQRVVLELFTERGSMPFLPTRGSRFLTIVRSGGVRTAVDVHQAFAFGAADVERNLTADETPADPADERLVGLALLSFSLTPGRLTLSVRINSAAGSSVVVDLPITTNP